MTRSEPRSPARFKQLFEQLDDAVVEFALVDGEPIVLDVNCAFVDEFGYETDAAVGEPLNDLIVPPSQQEEAEGFDRRTADGESNAAVVRRQTVDGTRMFVYRGVPYDDACGFAIYTDVTEQLQRERHLDVLQRVLRHNLRNDLNIILGMADMISEFTEEPRITEAATKIKETAAGLSRLSEEAKIVDRVLGEPTTLEATRLQPIVEAVVVDYRRQFEAATITTDVPASLAVTADHRLRILLRSLVENALVHNDSPTPTVEVRARRTDDMVHLEVVDNGPGIPDDERQVVTGDAEITPLNHGSGLGLWLVKWITDTYGGRLDIETDTDGTEVRVLLTRAECSPSESA